MAIDIIDVEGKKQEQVVEEALESNQINMLIKGKGKRTVVSIW
jgi:hypothetical protein